METSPGSAHALEPLWRPPPPAQVLELPGQVLELPAQALELCTDVGQTHNRWSCAARGSPTPVPISNACTDLSRLGSTPGPRPQPAALPVRDLAQRGHALEVGQPKTSSKT